MGVGDGRAKRVLDTVASIIMVATSAVLLWVALSGRRTQKPIPLPRDPLSTDESYEKGSLTAPVVLMEFGDFQCPFCSAFALDVLPKLDQDYVETGRVRFVFSQFPLPIHRRAAEAAEAAECAGRQGKFWEYHDALFRSSGRLEDLDLARVAVDVGVDSSRLEACVRAEAPAVVRNALAEAHRLGLTSTPTFFVGIPAARDRVRVQDIVLGGAEPALRRALDRMLASNMESRQNVVQR